MEWECRVVQNHRRIDRPEGGSDPVFELPEKFIPIELGSYPKGYNPVGENKFETEYFYLLTYLTPVE